MLKPQTQQTSTASLEVDLPVKPAEPELRREPYHDWLDTPKNRSGAALTAAFGLVRVSNPEGTESTFVEVEKVDAFLQEGWTLDPAPPN